MRRRIQIAGLAAVLLAAGALSLAAQAVHHPTRLILKDGSYQAVTQYAVKDGVVHYRSAERDNAAEEIPASLVDWDATHAWEQAHTDGGNGIRS